MSGQFDLVEYVQQQESVFLPAITDDSVSWAKESQFAIQALFKNQYTADAAVKNPVSLQNAIINVAAIGITLNPAAKHAYLVPRDGAICLDISYMGLLHLAMQTGSILWGQCKLVHDSDTYENQGLDSAPLHKYKAFGDRGAVVGGYCTVKTASGDYLTEEMSLEEITKIQKTSKSANSKFSPWNTFWDQMARKTIVKRASKYWPNVERLDKAVHYLNENGEGIEKEPELAYYSPEQINNMKAESREEFTTDIQAHCDRMDLAESMASLKREFQAAYKKTTGDKLQTFVQQTYAKNKARLENDSVISNS